MRPGCEWSGESGRGVGLALPENGEPLKVLALRKQSRARSSSCSVETHSVLGQRWWPNVQATGMGCRSLWDVQTCAGCGDGSVGCGWLAVGTEEEGEGEEEEKKEGEG